MSIDKTWHLADSEEEISWTEFELQLWRVYYAFERWQIECEKVSNGLKLSVDELAVLHIIRMNERSKTIAEIGRLLNRVDPFNINYIIKNLIKRGLVKKDEESSGQQLLYTTTEAGIENTNAYRKARKNILFSEFLQEVKNTKIKEILKRLTKVKNIYDEAYQVASSYKTKKNQPEVHTTKSKNNKK